ncbi:hypothetical protein M9H77_11982 [Catharanthus roseus]|uniref:Uncharacterized protein n=1 Tax=Catharanthus roseus TaxID=4058 RepID=A0ACC0BGB0_CATRO|nr:hypothetical protein M9H77_11982 [Catharanthus roseus]
MAIENEVHSSPPNLSNHVDDNDDDLNSLLIEMYHELEKITKKKKELKNKIDNLSNENSKLVCENKTLLESLEVVKKESDSSKLEFQKLILENKDLCEKVFSLKKCMVDYDDLKKKGDLAMYCKMLIVAFKFHTFFWLSTYLMGNMAWSYLDDCLMPFLL